MCVCHASRVRPGALGRRPGLPGGLWTEPHTPRQLLPNDAARRAPAPAGGRACSFPGRREPGPRGAVTGRLPRHRHAGRSPQTAKPVEPVRGRGSPRRCSSGRPLRVPDALVGPGGCPLTVVLTSACWSRTAPTGASAARSGARHSQRPVRQGPPCPMQCGPRAGFHAGPGTSRADQAEERCSGHGRGRGRGGRGRGPGCGPGRAQAQHRAPCGAQSSTGLVRCHPLPSASTELTSLFFLSADQALDRFAMKKYYDDKVSALMQPSQKRYVYPQKRCVYPQKRCVCPQATVERHGRLYT